MRYELVYPGSNAMIAAQLEQGELIRAEAGTLVSRSERIEVRGLIWGGWGRAMKRSLLGGETFFFQTLTAAKGEGQVLIAPSVPGDIKILPMDRGQDYFVQAGCLLAAFDQVQLDTKAQKITAGLFSGAGFFVLHLKGRGAIAISAFGAVIEVSIAAGEKYVVNNSHLVAWSGDTSYTIVKGGQDWMSSFTSGAGLACQFIGPGKLWLQSRNPKAFGAWVRKYAPAKG
jgi:uncharacterized protein (TIGR00266 family)